MMQVATRKIILNVEYGQVEDLIKRFDVDLSGRIEFGNGEFLGVIASIGVTSVQDIDDFVFSAAFRTFDHVSM